MVDNNKENKEYEMSVFIDDHVRINVRAPSKRDVKDLFTFAVDNLKTRKESSHATA